MIDTLQNKVLTTHPRRVRYTKLGYHCGIGTQRNIQVAHCTIVAVQHIIFSGGVSTLFGKKPCVVLREISGEVRAARLHQALQALCLILGGVLNRVRLTRLWLSGLRIRQL